MFKIKPEGNSIQSRKKIKIYIKKTWQAGAHSSPGNIKAVSGSCACFRLLQESGLFNRPLSPFRGAGIFCDLSVDLSVGHFNVRYLYHGES